MALQILALMSCIAEHMPQPLDAVCLLHSLPASRHPFNLHLMQSISLQGLRTLKVPAVVQALDLYRQLLAGQDADPLFHTYAAACLYYMGLYDQAEAAASEVS